MATNNATVAMTVAGCVKNEDVDFYAVDLKKGQRLTVEVEGMRLGTTLFDPYIAILDTNRFELAAVDDTARGARPAHPYGRDSDEWSRGRSARA